MDPVAQFKSLTEVMEMFYFWPEGDNPDNVNYLLFIKLISLCSAAGFPAMLTFVHVYHNRFAANTSMMMDLVVILVTTEMTIMYFLFARNLKEIVTQLNFYNPKFNSLHSIRVNYKKINRAVRYFVLIIIILVGLFVQQDTENCEKRKTRSNSLESCGLLFPIYLPFDYNFFPLKQYILIHQVVGVGVIFTAFVQITFVYLFLVVNAVGMLATLSHLVDDLNNCLKHKQEVTNRLKALVDVHQFLLGYISQVNNTSRYIIFTTYIFASLIMASSIFDVIKTGNILSAIHGSILLIGSFLFQLAGQQPIDKGLDFERALYNTHWYQLRKSEDRRCFLLLLHMSQMPVALYLGPFTNVSLETFLELLKRTYSGTTMLIDAIGIH